jgi:arylsulfatase A-like enzyme
MIATRWVKCEFNASHDIMLLINYRQDPLEQTNLADKPAWGKTAALMKHLLDEHNRKSARRWAITLIP